MKKVLIVFLLGIVLAGCEQTVPKPELKITLPPPPSFCDKVDLPKLKKGEDIRVFAGRLKVFAESRNDDLSSCRKWIEDLAKEYQ
jgi:hypothetical protein